MSPISKTLMNGLHVVDQQMMSGTTSVLFMRIFAGMLFVPKLSSSTHFAPQNRVGSSYTILTYCISSSLWYWYVLYDLSIPIIFFFCPFDILWYKFLSYREVLHVLSLRVGSGHWHRTHITIKKHTNVATQHIIFGNIFWNSLPVTVAQDMAHSGIWMKCSINFWKVVIWKWPFCAYILSSK